MEPQNSVPAQKDLYVPLDHLDEYQSLTEHQKNVLTIYFNEPGISKKEIALRSGVELPTVYKILHSAGFKRINEALALREKEALVLPALRALKGCLEAKNASTRLQAALEILRDADVMKKHASIEKKDTKIMVVFGKDAEPTQIKPAIEGAVEAAEGQA